MSFIQNFIINIYMTLFWSKTK